MELRNGENLKIEEAIVNTIAFFDMFDYPLTVWQIWKYLPVKCEFGEVVEILNSVDGRNSARTKLLQEKQGFYFLSGREEIIRTRLRRYNYANTKFKRASMIAKVFKFIPWIKFIAVGNIIGEQNLKRESDIDLFIAVEPGRIWLSRFFCVLITKILRLRPKQNAMRDKICLSFFINRNSLGLKEFMLAAEPAPDYYFIYWLAGIVPILNQHKTYEKLMAENIWLKEYLPNFKSGKAERFDAGKNYSRFYHDLIDILIGGLENKSKNYQLKILPEELKSAMNKNSNVVVNDKILKFHLNDRRKEYREKYEKKLVEINGN